MAEPTLQRQYETIYILRSDVAREVSEAVAGRVVDAINTAGQVTSIENWGRRKLAYAMGKQKRGLYVYFQYAGVGDLVSEVERTLRLSEAVLKFQTVKTGEIEHVEPVADVKYEHLEELDDGDDEETYAQTLGLEGRSSSYRNEPVEEQDDSDGDDESGSDDSEAEEEDE